MRARKPNPATADNSGPLPYRPLSALLSQTLVAFTVEFDNEFERRMCQTGYPGSALSMVVWFNLMRFLVAGDLCVRDLAARALAPQSALKFQLGCLERWRFVVLKADPADSRPIPQREYGKTGRILRDGWGSGRGIRSEWLVRLSEKGRKAAEIWPCLPGDIEQRWNARFGHAQLNNLRQALYAVLEQIDLDLPQGLPAHWTAGYLYPKLGAPRAGADPIPVLLSQLLLMFTIEFDRESRVPLKLCGNTLRVLSEAPVPLADIPRLTGSSPENTDVGWESKPYISILADPAAKRGKAVRLTPRGLTAQRTYHKLIRKIEERWQERFGKEKIRRIRDCLGGLFVQDDKGRFLLSQGLLPAEGTIRAGQQAPALGRTEPGPASRQRMRHLVVQTEMFVRDPVNALPHYPLWDMNRGFGP